MTIRRYLAVIGLCIVAAFVVALNADAIDGKPTTEVCR